MNPTQSKLTFTLPTDTDIEFKRDFIAPKELVFDAMTLCEHMPKWMTGPDGWVMSICETDLVPGGAFRWGWTKTDGGEPMIIVGEYTEIDRPNRVVNIERWGGPWPDALNTLVLTEAGGVTTMTLTCSYPTKDDRDNAIKTGMSDGMSISYDRLDAIFAERS